MERFHNRPWLFCQVSYYAPLSIQKFRSKLFISFQLCNYHVNYLCPIMKLYSWGNPGFHIGPSLVCHEPSALFRHLSSSYTCCYLVDESWIKHRYLCFFAWQWNILMKHRHCCLFLRYQCFILAWRWSI